MATGSDSFLINNGCAPERRAGSGGRKLRDRASPRPPTSGDLRQPPDPVVRAPSRAFRPSQPRGDLPGQPTRSLARSGTGMANRIPVASHATIAHAGGGVGECARDSARGEKWPDLAELAPDLPQLGPTATTRRCTGVETGSVGFTGGAGHGGSTYLAPLAGSPCHARSAAARLRLLFGTSAGQQRGGRSLRPTGTFVPCGKPLAPTLRPVDGPGAFRVDRSPAPAIRLPGPRFVC
jgi:hypothetical protein